MDKLWINFYINSRDDYWGMTFSSLQEAKKASATGVFATVDSRLRKSDLFVAMGYE